MVTSGAAVPTIKRLNQAKVDFQSNDGGAPGFYRDGARTAPYDLMSRLPELVKTLKKPRRPPAPYLPWGKESDFNGTRPAGSITARFGAGHTTQWELPQRHVHQHQLQHRARTGSSTPTRCIVVRVNTKDAGYTDPAGNFVPESVTTGRRCGDGLPRRQGAEGTWSKAGPTKDWTFKDAAGKRR